MSNDLQIVLSVPGGSKEKGHFTLQLKHEVFKEPAQYNKAATLLVLSGSEGNFEGLIKRLVAYKVIDKYLRWTFGEGHLVIMGNCFDQQGKNVECLWFIYSLEVKARKAGGYVHFLLGPDEVNNLKGDWRVEHPQYANSRKIPCTALYNGNQELWQWLCTKNVIEKIGDTLFTHEGLIEPQLFLTHSLSEINHHFRRNLLQVNNSIVELLDAKANNDDQANSKPISSEDFVINLLNSIGARELVTSNKSTDHLSVLFNRKLFTLNMDYTISNTAGLLIKGHRFYKVRKRQKRERIN